MTNNEYHTPVLFNESLDALEISANDIVIDVTYGGGGHSSEILNRLGPDGLLLAFDQDDDALENVLDDDRLIFANANFRFMINFAKYYEVMGANAILADLGVSSHQFDAGDRGFSIREEGVLDMRMNQNSMLTAYQVINKYSEKELYRVFNSYADLDNVRKVVQMLLKKRSEEPIRTTKELVDLLKELVKGNKQTQFLAQVFQAIRIEVNDEMGPFFTWLMLRVSKNVLVASMKHTVDFTSKGGNWSGDVSE
jgi:16S rRNA (cytosine1402-N4)-methyltransferase